MNRKSPRLLPILLLASFAPLIRAADYHVSIQGNDAYPGTSGKPFATLERARDATREARKGGHDSGTSTVWVHAGDYPVARTFELTSKDSGTGQAPVVYRGADDRPPRLLGSRPVLAREFKRVTDPATLARINRNAQGKILGAGYVGGGNQTPWALSGSVHRQWEFD